jgi:hypothetical protein
MTLVMAMVMMILVVSSLSQVALMVKTSWKTN